MPELTSPPLRAVIVDDHQLIRESLRQAIASVPTLHLIGEASDGPSGLALCREQRPDLLVLDLHLPGANGLELARVLREDAPAMRLIILTAHTEPYILDQLNTLAVEGIVSKERSSAEIVDALLVVAAGGRYRHLAHSRATEHLPEAVRNFRAILSDRELEVLRLVARGFSSKSIATELSLSQRTVENHRYALFRKTGAHNAAGLVKFARQIGLLSLPE
jgi:DNA-binding NarL/FixJ family response regulator